MTDKDKQPTGGDGTPADSREGAGESARKGEAEPQAALTPAQAIEVARASAREAAREAEAAEAQDAGASAGQAAAGAGDTTADAAGTGTATNPASAQGTTDGSAKDGTADDRREAAEPAPSGPVAEPPSAAAPPPPPPPEREPAPAAAPARPIATPIAWLALILVLLLAAAGFTQLLELQRREAALLQRVQGLEAVSGQDDTTFDQMGANLRRQIELELEAIEARQARAEEDQQRGLSRLESAVGDAARGVRRDLAQEIETLRGRLQDQQQRINDLSVDDRQSWQLAEAQYLLRLANQRLIMTGDTASAEALLRSADGILREMGEADLHDLREAVASDLAAVRAVPRLDIQGLYLRLEALIRQTDALVLFELPGRAPEVEVAPAEGWQDRLKNGVDAAVAKLSEYIVVSRRDVPVESLMDPQYEGLVRQNMRMLLEQAQVAMLSGNDVLYRQSLERAEGWVTQFFKADQQAAQAMAEELRLLRDERVSVDLPDLTASLSALGTVMKARLAAGGD